MDAFGIVVSIDNDDFDFGTEPKQEVCCHNSKTL